MPYGQPIEVVSTFTGRNTPSGPFKNQTPGLLPFALNVTLNAFVTTPGWNVVVWPRFCAPGVNFCRIV
jgi:hypothetical protein